jgi:hypothetical protein
MFFCLLLILLHRGIKPTAAGAKAIAVDDAAEPADAGGESATLANRDQAAIPSKLDAKDAPPAEAEPRSAGGLLHAAAKSWPVLLRCLSDGRSRTPICS